MNPVIIAAQFIKPISRADRSVRLEFETGEVSGDDIARLYDYRQLQGWLLFSPNELSLEDIPEVRAEEMDAKTPSQRLRNILYVYWQQKGKPGTWEQFYITQMSKLVDIIKEKLEPEG